MGINGELLSATFAGLVGTLVVLYGWQLAPVARTATVLLAFGVCCVAAATAALRWGPR